MFHRNPYPPFLRTVSVIICFLFSLAGLQGAAKDEARLKFICVSNLPREKETVLASRSDKGRWRELEAVDLRPSTITDWLPAKAGEMHLAVKEGRDFKSICTFEWPANCRRAIVALVADTEANVYKARVLDLDKIEFAKGSLLIVNFAEQEALVKLGSNERKIGPGQQEVVKPGKEEDATYRQTVSYLDPNGKEVLCHDRHVPGNEDSRELLFILTDKILGLKVANLPIFGSLD